MNIKSNKDRYFGGRKQNSWESNNKLNAIGKLAKVKKGKIWLHKANIMLFFFFTVLYHPLGKYWAYSKTMPYFYSIIFKGYVNDYSKDEKQILIKVYTLAYYLISNP